VASTTVLVIAGISISAVSRGLTDAAALCSPDGITLNVFDSLAYLPDYSETLESQPLPRPAAALRNAAIEAHATMVLTHYYGHIPKMVHNAIDWLTRGWNHSALHDKPLSRHRPHKRRLQRDLVTPPNRRIPPHRGGPRHRTHHRDHPARGRHKTRGTGKHNQPTILTHPSDQSAPEPLSAHSLICPCQKSPGPL